MQLFTGFQYLLIDAANNFGLDKLLFEQRIEWAMEHLHELESLIADAETPALYAKAVMAIRKAQDGRPTGHLVGFDACCSGIQIMSACTGCIAGATATGLVDPNVRADAYSKTTEVMNTILGGGFNISRADAKSALMKSFYGSKKVPLDLFGKETPELDAFYEAANIVAPGAWELLQDLLGAWQPHALVHSWKLPDGYDARVKVMDKIKARIEVDELDHTQFNYEFYENLGTEKGKSLVANVVHSIDAYVLRGIHRRCNYDLGVVAGAQRALLDELQMREDGYTSQLMQDMPEGKLAYYMAQYERSGLVDVVILPYIIDGHQTQYLSTEYMQRLLAIVDNMLVYRPFEVVTIHDEFRCHANNMDHLRQQYISILAELAEGDLLSDLFQQITGTVGTYPKLSNNLGALIRGSNYALC